jgi:hypothetical protein
MLANCAARSPSRHPTTARHCAELDADEAAAEDAYKPKKVE